MEKFVNNQLLVENENIVEIINLLTIKKTEFENYLKNGEPVQDAVHDYWDKLENGRELIELEERDSLKKRLAITLFGTGALLSGTFLLPISISFLVGSIVCVLGATAQICNYVFKNIRVKARNQEIDEANNVRISFEKDRQTAQSYLNTIEYLIRIYEYLLHRKNDIEDYYKFAFGIYRGILDVEVEESSKIEYNPVQGVLKVVGSKKFGENNKVLSMPLVILPPVTNK